MIEKFLELFERLVVALEKQGRFADDMGKIAMDAAGVSDEEASDLGGIGDEAAAAEADAKAADPAKWDRAKIRAELDLLEVDYNKNAQTPTLLNLLKVKMGVHKPVDAPAAPDAAPPSAPAPAEAGAPAQPGKAISAEAIKNKCMSTMVRLTDEAGMSDVDAKTAVRNVILEFGKVEKLSEIPAENREAVANACDALGA